MPSVLPAETTVLVIGGGPVGLIASGLLSQARIPNVVIERRKQTQRAPAAHVLRRRSMQILAGLGVADEVRAAASPLALDYITWCTTLGGSEIGRLELRPRDPSTGARPPETWTNCPQNLLEPILLRRAVREPLTRVVRGAECFAIETRGAGVMVRVRLDDGSERELRASWAIAADGAGSSTRRALGIPLEGKGPLGRFLMVHFEADLTPWIAHRPGPIFWLMNPESPGTLIVHHPERSHVLMMPARSENDDAEQAAAPERLAKALGVPVPAKILSIDTWSPHVQVASRYRDGRVFLAGDAAHRFPPTGGLGLNTGIQEIHDLVARLARVIAANAEETLLDGYEAAFRPVAQANASESFENMLRLGEIARALGSYSELAALEQRLASLTQAERAALDAAIEAQRSHFESDGASPDVSR
ncbi:MAG: FAD-dependent monooxygenase [Myxococcota bacterium]